MKHFALLPGDSMYIFPPPKPVIEGPELSNLEKTIFLIVLAIIAVVAVAVTVYFYRLMKKQSVKDKSRLIKNQREETVIHINGKDNIHA